MARSIAALVVVLGTLGVSAAPAAAQARPAPAVEFAGGALLFPDDGTVTEGFVGAAGRFYLSPLLSVGPEFAYIAGSNHSHLMLTGNLTVDLAKPGSAVVPFVVAGAGLFQTNENLPVTGGSFTHNEGAFTAGGGVRALVGDRVIVGAEARLGWEAHVRFNGFLGFRLGK